MTTRLHRVGVSTTNTKHVLAKRHRLTTNQITTKNRSVGSIPTVTLIFYFCNGIPILDFLELRTSETFVLVQVCVLDYGDAYDTSLESILILFYINIFAIIIRNLNYFVRHLVL